MFCTNCGKKLPDGTKFCSGCGTPTVQKPVKKPIATAERSKETSAPISVPEPITKPTTQPVPVSPVAEPAASVPQHETPPDPMVSDNAEVAKPAVASEKSHAETLEVVVRKNIPYYSQEFQKAEAGKKPKFNWAAFFFSAFFCLYRKCSELFKKYFLIPIVITLVAVILTTIGTSQFSLVLMSIGGIATFAGSVWAFVNCIRLGKNFNAAYYQHCQNALATGNAKKYGTAIGAPVLLFAVILLVSFVAAIIPFANFSNDTNEMYNFLDEENVLPLSGKYSIVGDNLLRDIVLDFDASQEDAVQMSVDGQNNKYQCNQVKNQDGTVYLRIWDEKNSGTLFSSVKSTTKYIELTLVVNSDGTFTSSKNGGYYATGSGPYTLIPVKMENQVTQDSIQTNDITSNISTAEATSPSTNNGICGEWQDSWSERCGMTIADEGDNYYSIDVIWSGSATEYDEWIFSGYYDESSKTLQYNNGNWFSYAEDESGYLQEGYVLDNMEGRLYLEGDVLRWEDYTSVEYDCDFGAANMQFNFVS